MISIDIYFQFLPHWAGVMIFKNFEKILKDFNIVIETFYIYPNFISIKTNLTFIDGDNSQLFQNNQNILKGYNDQQYNTEQCYKKLTENVNTNFKFFYQKIIEKSYKNQTQEEIKKINTQYKIEFLQDKYLLMEEYNSFINLIDIIVDKSLKYNPNYPKNIFWSNIGKYTLPRPCTGYGFTYNNNQYIIKGHCFPIKQYYDFNWCSLENFNKNIENNLQTFEEKSNNLMEKINNLNKEYYWTINTEEINKIIYSFYDPYPLIGSFQHHNLPMEIVESCLKNHNDGFLLKNKQNNNYKFLVFIHKKNFNDNLNNIIKEYEDTVNIRLEETNYYYQLDKNQNESYWIHSLNNIMFFEDKISMGHKRNTVKKILNYLLNLTHDNNYNNNEFLENLSYYLLDINSKIVQEFNDLQGFISSNLLSKNQYSQIIYDYYKKNYTNIYSCLLTIANYLFDIMMTLGLGGIMTPHKDPFNLKGSIDSLLELLIVKEITIDYNDIINIFNNDYEEKFLWKNTINSIESRWILKINNCLFQENKNILGFNRWNNYLYYNKIQNYQELKKRLKGLLKKNNNEEIINDPIGQDDELFHNYINEIKNINTYENCYYWLEKYNKFLLNYLDSYKIKGHKYRENLIEQLIHWNLYE